MSSVRSYEDLELRSRRGSVTSNDEGEEEQVYSEPLSPREYEALVSEHAAQVNGTSLYPGQNFDRLASYLDQAFTGMYAFRHGSFEAAHINLRRYPFLYLQRLNKDIPYEAEPFDDPNAFFHATRPGHTEKEQSSAILFLRGQPSPLWLATIGARYRVDPEFFQRHLDFRSVLGKFDYFPLPTLPFATENIIQLRVITVGHRGSPREFDPKAIRTLRCASKEAMNRYRNEVNESISSNESLGFSLVREYCVLDESQFAIMQTISMCVIPQEDKWQILAWLDIGKELTEGPEGPWLSGTNRRSSNLTTLYPVIQVKPWAALETQELKLPEKLQNNNRHTQSASLLHLEYGKTMDRELMSTDAFYCMHELFVFAAFSEAQFLNMMASKIKAEYDAYSDDEESWDPSNSDFTVRLLEEHKDKLLENIKSIKARGGPMWPRSPDQDLQKKAEEEAQSLLASFQDLLDRIDVLIRKSRTNTEIFMNRAMIEESRAKTQEAKQVTKLSKLAYVFIPVSFTASFFGMNLTPLVSANHSIWLWFAVSIPTLMISMLALLDWSRLIAWYRRRRGKTATHKV